MSTDLAAVRALGLAISFNVHGVDVTVTPPDADPIVCRGLWMTPLTTSGLRPVG